MKFLIKFVLSFLFVLLINFFSFAQLDDPIYNKLKNFIEDGSEYIMEEIVSDTITQILNGKVYFIQLNINNEFEGPAVSINFFKLIDNGISIGAFEGNKNWEWTSERKNINNMPGFVEFLNPDFVLSEETAPIFQGLLDLIYPESQWRRDEIEYFFKDDKWYFTRSKSGKDHKQGFEVTIDSNGKVTSILYALKFDG